MITRIVILGHTGFIGKRLELSLSKNFPALSIIGKSLPTLDLTVSGEVLKDYFGPETAVVMCAAVKKQLGDSVENCQKNLAMILNLCPVLEKHPVQRLIYFSSAAVYGEQNHNLNITEDTPWRPTSYYGLAKVASELLLQQAHPKGLVILRPPVIYGSGDYPGYGPSGFLHSAVQEGKIILWGDGTELREFLFIDDVIGLVEKIIFSPFEGTLNLASGRSHTFAEIVDTIRMQVNTEFEVLSRERTNSRVDHRFNNLRLKSLFPEVSFTSLKEGIQKMTAETERGQRS